MISSFVVVPSGRGKKRALLEEGFREMRLIEEHFGPCFELSVKAEWGLCYSPLEFASPYAESS